MARTSAWILLVILSICSVRSWADGADSSCPMYPAVQTRVDARAKYLVENFPALGRVGRTAPDLTLGLANVIAARAKEEARIWLIGQIANELCAANDKAHPYFPNTCSTVKSAADYPGPSLTLLRTQFKRDIYALPACYLSHKYFPSDTANVQPKDDSAIDPYVAEAALVGIYLSVSGDTGKDQDAPTLSSSLRDIQLGQILASTSTGILKKLSNGIAHDRDQATCSVPADQDLIALADDLSQIIADGKTNKTKSTPETVLEKIKGAVVAWCPAAGKQLELVADTYSSAIRGNYTEAALSAANEFLCPSTGKLVDARICSRIPVIAEVASAKTQSDMEAALDHVIEPIGAWKRKQSEVVWSLDAMAGAAIGTESLRTSGASANHFTTGLFLPVGLEYSHPLHWGIFKSGAVGLTVLDLGGLVSYSQRSQLAGGQTSSASDSHWSSVTAPGGYLALAFKDSPFRIGITASRTPNLRSLNFNGGTSMGVDSTRVMLFVTADVTLIAF